MNAAAFGASLVPSADSTYNLGSLTKFWNACYADSVRTEWILPITNTIAIGDSNATLGISIDTNIGSTYYIRITTNELSLTGTTTNVGVSGGAIGFLGKAAITRPSTTNDITSVRNALINLGLIS